MQVIRRRDNPLEIKAFGFVPPGSLGTFDGNEFEEVELDELPENWELYKEIPLAMGKNIVAVAQEAFKGQNGFLRAALLSYFDNFPLPIETVLSMGLDDEAKEMISALAALNNGIVNFSLLSWLESTTCNPMTESDFDLLIHCLDLIPFTKLKDKYKPLALPLKQKWTFKQINSTNSAGQAIPPPVEVQQLVDNNQNKKSAKLKLNKKLGIINNAE